jgi:hypothetical protein
MILLIQVQAMSEILAKISKNELLKMCSTRSAPYLPQDGRRAAFEVA